MGLQESLLLYSAQRTRRVWESPLPGATCTPELPTGPLGDQAEAETLPKTVPLLGFSSSILFPIPFTVYLGANLDTALHTHLCLC